MEPFFTRFRALSRTAELALMVLPFALVPIACAREIRPPAPRTSANGCTVGLVSCPDGCADLEFDPTNCGVCGRNCRGGACRANLCQPMMLASADGTSDLAVDGSSVYWANRNSGTVMSAPLIGGRPTMLARLQNDPTEVLVYGTNLYWQQTNGLMRLPLSGGTPVMLGARVGSACDGCMVTDGADIYAAGLGRIMKVPLDGGPPLALASGRMLPHGLAVDERNAYWTSDDLKSPIGTVMRVPLVGGQPVTLAVGQNDPEAIAVDATTVYWTNHDDGTVMSLSKTGGQPTVLASAQGGPSSIAVDGTSAYWTNRHSGTVMKVPLVGGPAVVLASGQSGATGIIVDDTCVYWIRGDPGASMPYEGRRVMKLAK